MSLLGLRVNLFGDGPMGDTQVVANVYPADKIAGKAGGGARNQLIPAGDNYHSYKTVELPPGGYTVQVDLPSGRSVSSHVNLPEEGTNLSLEAGLTPHEWMAWQHLVGNVGDLVTADSSEHQTWMLPTLGKGGSPFAIQRTAQAFDEGASLDDFLAQVPADQRQIEARWVVADAGSFARRSWPWLARLIEVRADANDVVRMFLGPYGLNYGSRELHVQDLRAYQSDSNASVFRIDENGPVGAGANLIDMESTRSLALIRASDWVDLVSIPLPWVDIDRHQQVTFEILVMEREQAVAGTVHDPALGSLLGYMTNRFMRDAAQLVRRAEEMLFHKVTNPLGSAAGAYVMVANGGAANEEREWHGWIANLRRLHPWLPDGAVAHAKLLLEHPEMDEDGSRALEAVLDACARGLPYYAIGARWLLDALTIFEEDPELRSNRDEIRSWLSTVRTVASRINYQQPFTTIRLTPDSR